MSKCAVCKKELLPSVADPWCDTCGRRVCADCIDYTEQLRDDTDTICVPCGAAQKTRRRSR